MRERPLKLNRGDEETEEGYDVHLRWLWGRPRRRSIPADSLSFLSTLVDSFTPDNSTHFFWFYFSLFAYRENRQGGGGGIERNSRFCYTPDWLPNITGAVAHHARFFLKNRTGTASIFFFLNLALLFFISFFSLRISNKFHPPSAPLFKRRWKRTKNHSHFSLLGVFFSVFVWIQSERYGIQHKKKREISSHLHLHLCSLMLCIYKSAVCVDAR